MKTLPLSTKTAGLTLALTAVIAPVTWAQRAPATPEQRQENREERRQRIESMPPEQRQQYFQQRIQERLKSMTPEQRQRWEARRAQMEQMRRQEQLASVSGEDRQKYLMNSAGVEDATQQDAIIAFVLEQARQRQTVLESAKQLSTLLADKTSTPEALSAQLQALQTVSKAFRTWKEGALKELDTKISYTSNPRLASLMTLVGILGDEATDAGGFNAIFPGGLAGGGDITTLLPQPEGGFGGWGGMGGGGGGRDGNQPAQEGQPAAADAPANQGNQG